MILPRREDALHKTQMFRLLREILKNNFLANELMFKGGTCAALRGSLDRFSVDLDFDLPDKSKIELAEKECLSIIDELGYEIKDRSQKHLQFFLRYQLPTGIPGQRNTLKFEINDDTSPFNIYEKAHLQELDMYCNAQSLETMFANKLVAAKARFDKTGKIAGRDFYDLHHFFMLGMNVNREVVEERTQTKYSNYLTELIDFINISVNERELNEDLNVLMTSESLKLVLPRLKEELLVFLNDELRR